MIFFENKSRILMVLIVILSGVIYVNAIDNDFALDDDNFIIRSDYIKDWKNAFTIFTPEYLNISAKRVDINRPIMTWSLMWDYYMWGMNPSGFHLTNIIIHLSNVSLIYLLGILLFESLKIPLIGALLFGIHPINTEAVNGINFREDLLVTAFYLLALITFIKCTKSRKSINNCLLSFVFTALALLSKEAAVTLPFVMILYQFIAIDTFKNAVYQMRRLYAGIFILVAFYLTWLLILAHFTDLPKANYFGEDWYISIHIAAKLFVHYVKLLIFPINLNVDHNLPKSLYLFDYSDIVSLLAFLISISSVAYAVWKKHLASIFLFLFLITLSPVTITYYQQPFAERFLYLPSVGWSFLSAIAVSSLYDKTRVAGSGFNFKTVFITSFVTILILFSFRSFRATENWKNDYSIWENAVKGVPDSPRACYYMGKEYSNRRLYTEALEMYKRALRSNHTRLIMVDPERILVDMGIVYSELGQYTKSVEAYEAALKEAPQNSIIYYNLGMSYHYAGNDTASIENLKRAIDINSELLMARLALAGLYLETGDKNKAIAEYESVIKISPDSTNGRLSKKLMVEAMQTP